jgi:hypothetical protein
VKRKARYKGRIDTVGDAAMADHNVEIACTRCSNSRHMYAYKLASIANRCADIPLGLPVPGFYCKWCRQSVEAIVRSMGPFAG